MQDLWNREVKLSDLVLGCAGKGDMEDMSYGLVVGENEILNTDGDIFKTNYCYLIGEKTEEQEKIYAGLRQLYNQHMIKVMKAGGYEKIVPEPMHLYVGDSSSIYYLYFGRLRVYGEGGVILSDKYTNGGHCYLRITKSSGIERDIKAAMSQGTDKLEKFKGVLFDDLSFITIVLNRSNSVMMLNSNLVISTRNRTFKKDLGKFELPGWMASGREVFDCTIKSNYMNNHRHYNRKFVEQCTQRRIIFEQM